MDNLLSGGLPSIRSSILSRYCKFFRSLKISSSFAVRVVASICYKDVRSFTGSNLSKIAKEVKLDLVWDLLVTVQTALLGRNTAVPKEDCWRIGCLRNFLAERYVIAAEHRCTDEMDKFD